MKVDNKIAAKRADWSFEGEVADNFVDHVRKSVPGYDEGHEIICKLSDFFCRRTTTAYEIGVSTGQLLKKLAVYNEHKPNMKIWSKSLATIVQMCPILKLFKMMRVYLTWRCQTLLSATT